MPNRHATSRRFRWPLAFVVLLLCAAAPRASAQTQRCLYVVAPTERGPRFVSDVFCIYGTVNTSDVVQSFSYWRRNRFSEAQNNSWGAARLSVRSYTSRARASNARNAFLRSAQGTRPIATEGWNYSPGAAAFAQGIDELSDALQPVLVALGAGFSMGTGHGESWPLTFGGSVRINRFRFHIFNPIEALSLGETGPNGEGVEYTERSGWGMEGLFALTPRFSLGVGMHPVRTLVQTLDSNSDPVLISDEKRVDPTVSAFLPMGDHFFFVRYGQYSRWGLGFLFDFGR